MFFLPLFDNIPTSRMPVISYAILGICISIFFWQTGLSPQDERLVFLQYGVVPSLLFGHQSLPEHLIPFTSFLTLELPSHPYLLENLIAIWPWVSIFSSMFLHGGWLHLGSNMLYLWIFSDNVEDSMGWFRFIIFYALCGVGAALSQSFIDPQSVTPMIGASGGIAGILGAYIILHPRASVRVFMLILIFIRIINLPAWLVLGIWIAGQFIAAPAGLSGGGGVAYFAHIGGFITGMCLIPIFKRRGVELFSGQIKNTPKSWSVEPVSVRQLKIEAHQRYGLRNENKKRLKMKGSLPSVNKRRGPWG